MSFTSFVHAHLQAVVLLAYAALAWVGVGYLWFPDLSDTKQEPSRLLSHWLLWLSVRSILAGVLISLASRQSVWIAAYTTLMSVLFSFVRRWLLPRQYAESEATGILIYFGGFVWLARATSTHPRFWGVFGFDPGHVAAVLLIISIVIYVEVGGTNIVRGLLEKGRVLPEFAPAAKANPPVTSEMLTSERPSEMGDQLSAIKDAEERQDLDREEYNHGRLIGNAERLLLLALVAIQAYQALAFLMTAKGLFRAKELENRKFSEYFLVGTLVSSGVAVAAGLFIQMILKLCW